MKIILDAMGGDNAPREIVMGAIEAINTLDVEIFISWTEREDYAISSIYRTGK